MKTNQSVYIIDSFSHHSFHEIFTSAFIHTCIYIFEGIFYYSCKSTRKCIKNILAEARIGEGKIEFKNIFVLEHENKYLLLLRYFVSTIINIFYLFKAPKNALIVYCYNNIFSSPLLNTLNKILNKNVVIICHGELELLNNDLVENLGPLTKIIKKNIVAFFLNKNIRIAGNLIFVVLGESILLNLRNLLPLNIIDSVYAIDHPFIFDGFKKKPKQQDVLSLGTIGVVSKAKNIDRFIYIAKLFLPEIKAKKIFFSATGAIYCKRKELLDVCIDIPNEDNVHISRDMFNARIQRLDYILFFYHSKMYRYFASGAVLDAINAEIPVIALKNDYFEYLFSHFGPFGYLVNSMDDMEKLIRKILAGEKIEFFSFKKIKENLSPLAVSRQFKAVLENAGLL